MATFNAAKRVERVKWDFQGADKVDPETGKSAGKFLNGEPGAVGELTEPGDDQVDRFLVAQRDIVQSAPEQLSDITDEYFSEGRKLWTDALVDLGIPADLLAKLPPRVFSSFRDFVVGELTPKDEMSVY